MKMRALIRWLVFSALWTGAFLIIGQFRMAWLCVFAGAVFGFLSDCLVDVMAVRKHQRWLRKRFEASEEPALPEAPSTKHQAPEKHQALTIIDGGAAR